MYRAKLRFFSLFRKSSRNSSSSSSSSSFPWDLNPTDETLASCFLGSGRGDLYPPWVVKSVMSSLDGTNPKFPESKRGKNLYPFVKSAAASLNGAVARQLKFPECVKSYGFSHSLESFAMLVGIFSSSSADMHREVRCLFRSVWDFSKSSNCELTLFLLYRIVHLSNGSITLSQAYGCLIETLAVTWRAHGYLVFLDAKEKGIEVGVPACNLLLRRIVERERNEDAVRDLYSALSKTPNLDTFTIMMDFYTKEGSLDLDEAENVFVEMEKSGISPDEEIYAMYLRGLCSAGRHVGAAWELLCDLQERGQSCSAEKTFRKLIYFIAMRGYDLWTVKDDEDDDDDDCTLDGSGGPRTIQNLRSLTEEVHFHPTIIKESSLFQPSADK